MINWMEFDKWTKDTCYCRCDKIFRSHGRFDMKAGRIITRLPCPNCGKNDDCYRIQSDPETMEI